MVDIYKKIKSYIGYILFILVLVYALVKAPDDIWNLNLSWVLIVFIFVVVMFVFEIFQFYLFLISNRIKLDLWPALQMNSRKAVLNTIFPAKPGTVYAATVISSHYGIGWGEYVRFLLYATAFMMGTSVIAGVCLFLPLPLVIFFIAALLFVSLFAIKASNARYLNKSFFFILISSAIYGCRLVIFWGLLQALGQTVNFYKASCFAISINILAQISITPGNMGIREICLGVLAPFISIDLSSGIIAGVIFQLFRLLTCALIMLLADGFMHKSKQSS